MEWWSVCVCGVECGVEWSGSWGEVFKRRISWGKKNKMECGEGVKSGEWLVDRG